MLVINKNSHPVPVVVDTPKGPDTVHVSPRGRVTLAAGVTVNANWLATQGSGIVVNKPTVVPKVPLKSGVDADPKLEPKSYIKSGKGA